MSQARIANFCPVCGTALETRPRLGVERPVCPACDHTVYFDPKVAVAVLLMQDDCILLVKRANDPFKGYWTMPAGFMEWDEDPCVAGCREVQEETGLVVQTTHLLDIFHTPSDGGLANIVIVYAATITGGNLQAADDAAEATWFSRATLPPNIAFLPTQTIVKRWMEHQL